MAWESQGFDCRSYAFSAGGLELRLRALKLLGGGDSLEIEECDGKEEVKLHEEIDDIDEWESIEVHCTLSGDSLGDVTPWLQTTCETTRIDDERDLTGAALDDLRFELDLASLRQAVVLRPFGVDPKDEHGLVVATGDGITIHVDPAGDPFGGGLETQWDAEFFKQRGIKNALTYLDVPASGNPKLYLNSGVRDFRDLLKSKGTSGPIPSARKLLLDQIEADTWFALARRAAGDVFEINDAGEVELVDEDLIGDWQGGALDRVAKYCRCGSGEEGRRSVGSLLLTAEHHEEVRSRIESSIGRGKGLRMRVEQLSAALGKGKK